MIIADLGVVQPRRFIRRDTGRDHHRLVAADRVEGQRRRIVLHLDDLAEGNQSQFNQSLETVADTEHQTIALF